MEHESLGWIVYIGFALCWRTKRLATNNVYRDMDIIEVVHCTHIKQRASAVSKSNMGPFRPCRFHTR